ncbi:MAG TPA: hypothetical protein VIZ31_04045 [Vicinamibacteria bacterium]
MGRKIGFLFLILGFGASVETAWSIKHNLGHIGIGPEGCRVIGGKFYGASFSFEDEGSRPLAAGGPVEIENSFGSVTVAAGAPGEVRVKISKRVYRPTQEEAEAFARRIELVLEERDGGLRIGTNRATLSREDPNVGFETALQITLPPNTRVGLKNEHGAVEMRDVAEARVDASFDSLLLERVAGATDVKHRHGDVEVNEIGGILTLEARHGNVSVRGVAGATRLDTEHGDVKVVGSAGLRVKHAHGGVTAKSIGGDLEVEAQHSEVDAQEITGAARITTAFAELRVAEVGGDATLQTEHGRVTARNVKGALQVETRYDGVTLENIDGPVVVRVEHGGVEARGLKKGLKIQAEGDGVRVADVRGPVELKVQRGEVDFSPGVAITEPVSIETTHGAIQLDVPAGSRFDLDARARHGELEVSLPGVPEASHDAPGQSALVARFGGGGSPVRLRSEGGSISVIGGAAAASN